MSAISDGFPASKTRTVIVYDPEAPDTDITGDWDGLREGLRGGPTTIEKVAPGIFFCSDLFGGWYEVGLGYGSAYRLRSYIILNADDTYSHLQTNSPWGPWEVRNGVYDPGAEVMRHQAYHPTFRFGFNVILTKK